MREGLPTGTATFLFTTSRLDENLEYFSVVEMRLLTRDEVELIWTIDRSEVHHYTYEVREGELVRVPNYFEILAGDLMRRRTRHRCCWTASTVAEPSSECSTRKR